MPDAFIWYHADKALEPELIAWVHQVEEQADVSGRLLFRIEQDKTTFMETYSDVSRATIERIEKLASENPLFADISRRCESFFEITP